MRTFRPPLPAERSGDVRLIIDLVGPVCDVELARLRDDPARGAASAATSRRTCVGLFGHDTVATLQRIEMSIAVGALYEVQDGRIRRTRCFSEQAAARADLA